jgi:hypothetical protein
MLTISNNFITNQNIKFNDNTDKHFYNKILLKILNKNKF